MTPAEFSEPPASWDQKALEVTNKIVAAQSNPDFSEPVELSSLVTQALVLEAMQWAASPPVPDEWRQAILPPLTFEQFSDEQESREPDYLLRQAYLFYSSYQWERTTNTNRLRDKVAELEAERATWNTDADIALADAATKIAELEAERELLAWNLAGCSTYALGYGLDNDDFDPKMARAALHDVRKLALRAQELEARLAVPLESEIANAVSLLRIDQYSRCADMLERLARRNVELEQTLRTADCPFPVIEDRTIGACVDAGKCGCVLGKPLQGAAIKASE